jgi:2-hydroxy-3-oxopropionate reductase
MIDRTFKPGFRVRLHRKDARIIERTARSLGIEHLVFESVLARLDRLVDAGDGELDHSALYLLAGRPEGSAGEVPPDG